MFIKGSAGIKEIRKKGAYVVSIDAGDVTIESTAFFSSKVDEKKIKKVEEGNVITFEGFTSTRESEYNGYKNFDTVLIINDLKTIK